MKFNKMNTANSPPKRGVGVGQNKNNIHFYLNLRTLWIDTN